MAMKETVDIKSLILCMIGINQDNVLGELGGATRLQKLLYLLEAEEGIQASNTGFEFEPYKAGPYSSKLYDALEFLENLGFIESEITGESTQSEAAELNFENLIEENDNFSDDYYVEKSFKLTRKGDDKVQKILRSEEYQPVVDKIRRIKSKFGRYSLRDLLYYVYTKYPRMVTESEIRDKILKRGWG